MNRKWSRVVGFATLISVLGGASVATSRALSAPDPDDSSKIVEDSAINLIGVDVQLATPTVVVPEVHAYGEVKARFQTRLASEVQGAVVSVSERTEAGSRVARGTELFRVDATTWLEAVARAQAELDSALVALQEENLRAEQARIDWNRVGSGGNPSPFLTREPHQAAAKQEVEAARAALREAERDLERTRIRAPFNAAVIQRLVAPGTYLQPGTEVVEIYSSDRFEVRLPLSEREWALLPPEAELVAQRWPVVLQPRSSSQEAWEATVIRVEKHVSSSTRQRALVVEIEDPLNQTPALYPGTFVRAAVKGRALAGVLALPVDTVTAQGVVWTVDEENRLVRQVVEPVVELDDVIVVKAFAGQEAVTLVSEPRGSFVEGVNVMPRPTRG